MYFFTRELEARIPKLTPPKAVVILGARQVGKSTLYKSIVDLKNTTWIDGDKPSHVLKLQKAFQDGDLDTILKSRSCLVIDEAQRIPDFGLIIKTLVDSNETTSIFVTGSSSLNLNSGVRESAVGRLVVNTLWPVSLKELSDQVGSWEVQETLSTRMVYGMYPEVFNSESPEDYLCDYASTLLFRDIFDLGGIKANKGFTSLVSLLAAHIGQEVSLDSLSRDTGLSGPTVKRYIELMEQAYIIRICGSYSTNLENELKKGKKIYFCDTGVRNALLDDFSPLSSRSDAGALWENFFYMERVKQNDYLRNHNHLYFWRTRTNGSMRAREVDFVEVKNRKPIRAFECKLNQKSKSAGKNDFLSRYPDTEFDMAIPESAVDKLLQR